MTVIQAWSQDSLKFAHAFFLQLNGFVSEGWYVRNFSGEAPHDGHAHHIPHHTFVAAEAVRFEWRDPDEGTSGVFIVEAPNFIPMPAKRWHHLSAEREGAMWGCYFSLAEAEKVERELGHPVPFNMEKEHV